MNDANNNLSDSGFQNFGPGFGVLRAVDSDALIPLKITWKMVYE